MKKLLILMDKNIYKLQEVSSEANISSRKDYLCVESFVTPPQKNRPSCSFFTDLYTDKHQDTVTCRNPRLLTQDKHS